MTDYGSFWNTHLSPQSQQEAAHWYAYPASLQREIDAYAAVADHAEPLGHSQYMAVLQKVRRYAQGSVAALKLPYHNTEHFSEMAAATLLLFDSHYGKKARLLTTVRQALEIAAWLHDCHHSGCTLRRDSRHPLYRPDLGTDIAVEYVSALAANKFLAGIGLPLPWRVFIVQCIWATTFAGSIAKNRGIRTIPIVAKPQTLYHALMRAADVWPTRDLFVAVKKGIDVNFHEIPATGRIIEPRALLKAQVGFERYRIDEMQHLDRLCGKSITRAGQSVAQAHAHAFLMALSGKRPDLVAFTTRLMQ